MRFVNKLSYSCANHFMNVLEEDHKKRAVYYFAFQIFIGALVKAAVLLILGFSLNMMLPLVLIVLVFASLRLLAGGYHMDTYGKCLFVSMSLFVFAGIISKYTYFYWNRQALIILTSLTLIYALYNIIKYAPKDTPNKPITDPGEIKKFKLLSLVYISFWTIVLIILLINNTSFIIIPLCFGVLLEVLTITPLGHKFFDMVKGSLTKNKKISH